MGKQAQRTGLAQNRIDYIAYHAPQKVRGILDRHGYVPPQDMCQLAGAARQLVREKGKAVVEELVKAHPDRQAILAVEKKDKPLPCQGKGQAENHFCGGCGHSYMGGNGQDSLETAKKLSLEGLKEYYEKLIEKANAAPGDAQLAEGVQAIWNELRKRLLEDGQGTWAPQPVPPEGMAILPNEAFIVLGLTLLAGVLIGSAIKR